MTLRCTASLVLALTALLGSGAAVAQDEQEAFFKSFQGKRPPELIDRAEHWLNWKGDISLEKLRGHVVWLEFSFIH